MKKLLFVLGGLFVVAVGGFVMIAMSASSVQKDFFAKVDAGQVDELMQSMHPALQDEIEQPVMETLVQTINTKLGKLKGVTQTSFSSKMTDAGTRVETEASVEFEKGTATSKLVTVDGKLIEFDVQSDQLIGWLGAPTSTALYEASAETFLTTFLTDGSGAAWDLCHESLQEAVKKEELAGMTAQVVGAIGALKSLKAVSAEAEDGAEVPTLVVTLEIVAEKAMTNGTVKFRFGGMRGDLSGFNVTLPEPVAQVAE